MVSKALNPKGFSDVLKYGELIFGSFGAKKRSKPWKRQRSSKSPIFWGKKNKGSKEKSFKNMFLF